MSNFSYKVIQVEKYSESIAVKLKKLPQLLQRKEYMAGLRLCDEIIEHEPLVYSVYSDRSFILREVGELQRAFDDINTLVNLRPECPTGYLKRAEWHLEFGANELAIKDLTFVINTEERYFLHTAYFYRAIGYLQLHRKREAKDDCFKLPADFSFYVKTLQLGGVVISRTRMLELADTLD